MELRALRGRPVIAIDSGERIGDVVDAFIDPQHRRITGLRVRRTGKDLSDVAFEDVQSIGADAVMLPSREVLKVASERDGSALTIEELVRLRVVTELGALRGTVDDAEFDPVTGLLTALIVAPSGLGGLLGRRQRVSIDEVRTIGRDAVVLVAKTEKTEAAGETSALSTEPE